MDKIVRVDMTQKEIKVQALPPVYEGLGGRALTSKVVCEELSPSCHPLGRRNKVVVATGLFAGTPLTCSGRLSIGAKSPLTGGIKESNVGGTAGTKLARIGIKAIIIEGKPQDDTLYFLKLDKNNCELIPAAEYYKAGNYQLTKQLRKIYGEQISVMSIGPAGELELAAAGIAVTNVEGSPSSYAARGGLGAVLGSKKIKAIIIDDAGSKIEAQFHDKKEFIRISKEFSRKLIEAKRVLAKYGTAIEICESNLLGCLPTRNYRTGAFEGANRIGGEAMNDLLKRRRGKTGVACMPGCVIRCSNIYNDENYQYLTSALEYETIVMLGSNLGIDDLDAIAEMDRLCDDFGLDTIEVGGAIGVAMEAGLLDFGDAKAAIELLKEIPKGSPLGRILGNGVEITGKVFGVRRIPSVKGQGMAGYDPRAMKGVGVTYMSSPMGADHTAACVIPGRTGFDPNRKYNVLKPDGQAQLSLEVQIIIAVLDAMGLCFFIGPNIETLNTLISLHRAKYGSEITFEDLVNLGKEILKTEREFNCGAGIAPVHHLPDFFEEEPLPPHNSIFDVSYQEVVDKFLNIV